MSQSNRYKFRDRFDYVLRDEGDLYFNPLSLVSIALKIKKGDVEKAKGLVASSTNFSEEYINNLFKEK